MLMKEKTFDIQECKTLINNVRKEKHEIDNPFNQLIQNWLLEEKK